MNYEERRLKIVMWTVVALLILSIAGASLLFIMKLRTPSTRLNTVNIGSRITGRGGFKSNLTNADVWDGTSADTVFAGSGTESSPYLITSAAEFYGLSKRINNGESFKDKYVSLTTDIDLNNKSWSSITRNNYYLEENAGINCPALPKVFLGNNHTIANVSTPGNGLFGYVAESTTTKIKDLNVEISAFNYMMGRATGGLISFVRGNATLENVSVTYASQVSVSLDAEFYSDGTLTSDLGFGGIVGTVESGICVMTNCNVVFENGFARPSGDDGDVCVGGLVGYAERIELTDCSVTGFNITNPDLSDFYTSTDFDDNYHCIATYFCGGLVGQAFSVKANKCYTEVNLILLSNSTYLINGSNGSLVAKINGGITVITECFSESSGNTTSLVGVLMDFPHALISNNLCQGKFIGVETGLVNYAGGLYTTVDNGYWDLDEEGNEVWIEDLKTVSVEYPEGFWTTGYQPNADVTYGFYNNINNATINWKKNNNSKEYDSIGGLVGNKDVEGNNVYNSTNFSYTKPNFTFYVYTYGATSDANMKLRSTYANWADFDEYWVIDPNINAGYPMLRAFVKIAQVTGFDGSGSQDSPYLIKTHQDLLGVASYYNDNNLTKGDIYWKVVNNIDVSRNANNALIHFTPICYNKSFDGYFDGNNKTISGLLIDNQYEYTGLFGTIASNHWVKNLTVKGNIYWDEAYAVGGVAGRILAGGYLQNCHFEGNIIGVLNTKTSTETSGVIGKYGINGAIDCTATYADLKYAKIGGTSDAPTYTYYLYDWARITTSLYNEKV